MHINNKTNYYIESSITLDKAEIYGRFNNEADFTNGFKEISAKVVVIQGTAATSNINMKDYNAVKKAFHLDDE